MLSGPRAEGLVARLQHLQDLALLSKFEGALQENHQAAICAAFADPEPLVRWAALSRCPISRPAIEALERATRTYPELAGSLARLRDVVAQSEDGTLGDTDTDDTFELAARAREGAAAGQWKRVARATEAILAQHTWDHEAMFLRGLAYLSLIHI